MKKTSSILFVLFFLFLVCKHVSAKNDAMFKSFGLGSITGSNNLARATNVEQSLFSEDISENIDQSTPSSPNIPLGLKSQFHITYEGAFRVVASGESTSDYAVGVIEYTTERNSLFLAGHAGHNAIAEFKVPEKFSKKNNISDIPKAEVLQNYFKILDKTTVGNTTNRITGMLYHKGSLLVNSEIWYNADGKNQDNLIVINNASSLKSSRIKGMLQLEGGAKAAGYMSSIPHEWQNKLGGKYLTGWASNYSITSRYSLGPSLYVFSPDDAISKTLDSDRLVPSSAKMVFPYGNDTTLVKNSMEYSDNVSPIWSILANARFGFIIPNSSTFMAVGHMSGLHGGIGYKVTQDNGNICGGGCNKKADDLYNYFWLFDLNEILDANQPHLIQPYSYGKWSHPFDAGGKNKVIGATFDEENDLLYISLENAGRVDKYGRPPLILVYKITTK